MNNYLKTNSIVDVITALNKKEVIAYPTEAVFSIGCDPDSIVAVNHLLKLKKRAITKGLILIAANYNQLSKYIDDSFLTSTQRKKILSTWPGPVTFVFPAKKSTPYWLTGQFNSLAVRITNHPLVSKLCYAFGKPLVSTSANVSGSLPCRTTKEIYEQFGNTFPIIKGKTSGNQYPSEIYDILTGEQFR